MPWSCYRPAFPGEAPRQRGDRATPPQQRLPPDSPAGPDRTGRARAFLAASRNGSLFSRGRQPVTHCSGCTRLISTRNLTGQPEQKVDHHQQAAKPAASKKKQEKWTSRDSKAFTHPWMLTTLKGHTGEVLDMDFSGNSKFLATCADDRSVLLWNSKHLDQKDNKSLRVNVEYDHATMVRWSPDSKAFIIHKGVENVVEVYKVVKKADGWIGSASKAITFSKAHSDGVVGMDIALNGRFIMTCSEKTDLVLWDLKGERLAALDTLAMQTHRARVSPCGHFIAASGFTPDVKVWEVVFTKSGEFDRVVRAFELKGHSSGVFDFAFSSDSSRMATISKDGHWRVFNTRIEYQKGEEPRLLQSGQHAPAAGATTKSHLALAPDGESLAVATGSDLHLYVVSSGKLLATIKDVYSGPINCVRVDSTGQLVLTAGDRHVRVLHNMAHHMATAEVCAAKLKESGLSAATKERLAELVASSKAFLDKHGVAY